MKETVKAVPTPSPNWQLIGALAVGIALVFFWPFLAIVLFAAVMAFLFFPIYRWINRRFQPFVAMSLTLLVSMLILLLPLALMLGLAIVQGFNFADSIAESANVEGTTQQSQTGLQQAVAQVNAILDPIAGGQFHVDEGDIKEFVSQTLPMLVKSLINVIIGFASSLPALFTALTIYLFMFAAFLIHGREFLGILREISPFHSKVTELYVYRTSAMLKASMLGQLLIAFVLAILAAFALFFVGLQEYFFFWVIIFTILNMVPLGSAVVIWPIAVIAMLTGNVTGGILLLIVYFFVICNIDNLMRPRLIPKTVQIVPALTSLSIFCGIYYFGILGVVYGPVIAILLVTTLDAYREHRKSMALSQPKAKLAKHAAM